MIIIYDFNPACETLRPIFFNFPNKPRDFFFSPGNNSLCVDSREPDY